jgi:flagellar M-ring protein FliF
MDLAQIRERVTTVFAGFTGGQKTVLVIAVVATLVGGLAFTRWAAAPNYAALYSNLPSADAASVTEELTTKGVPYQLADGGSTIMVPQAQVYQLRLDLSAQGLPQDGAPGYALLDKQGITASEFRQRVDYQRALEGELSKTLTAIEGVDAATVHLVIPSEDLFTKDAKKPSASVLLKGRPGQNIDPGQVQSVVHLVSSSIESMDPADVTVADAAGRVLKAPGEQGIASAAGDARATQTLAFQNELANSLQTMLAPLVGADQAVVRVNADLDFDQRQITTERFENEDNPVLTEDLTTEEYTGGAGGPVGVLGLDGEPVGGGEGADYNKEQERRAYAVGKVTENVKAAPGGVERMSVSVLLNGGGGANINAAQIEGLISAAAGLDPERGDVVEVAVAAFDDAAAEAAEAQLAEARAAEQRAEMMALARTVGVALIVAIALFLAYRSAKKSAVNRYPVAVPIDPPEEEERIDLEALSAPEPLEALPMSAADQQRLQVEEQIGDMIDRQPDEVAAMLRGWLADRRS